MTKTTRVLHRVLVNHFYTVNTGFFYFLFLIIFGAPSSPLAFHLSLITGIIQSGVFLTCVMALWVLYNLKCVDYVLKQLSYPRQSFLFCINCLPIRKTYLLLLYVQILVYLPVLIYSAAIVIMALKKQEYWCVITVILFNSVAVVVSAFLYIVALQKKQLYINKPLLPSLKIKVRKPLFLLQLYFLWYDRKQMLFITKIFSLLLLFGFFKLYEPYRYDIRPLQLCLLLTAGSHSAIVFQIRLFEEEYLSFSRNLPLTTVGRFLRIIALYGVLLVPEFILLFKGLPVHFALHDYPQLVLQLIALLCMFHTVLLLEDTNMEQFMRVMFGIMAGCFFVLLYNPGILFPVMILVLAFALYSSYYYDYEKKYKHDE